MRHAKSSWKDPGLKDFDRPLKKRGRENAPVMARRLTRRHSLPQLILSSPAVRARQTSERVIPELGGSVQSVIYEPLLYQRDVDTLLNVIRKIDDRFSDVLLIGHNPELTALANFLASQEINEIVTCGLVSLRLPVESWQHIQAHSGTVLFEDSPKGPDKMK